MEKTLNTLSAQKKAFRHKFAPGLLNPLSGMNVSVRLGQLALNILSRWSIKPLAAKPESSLNYFTIAGRGHWLMLRESMFSLYRSWKKLPAITVVSDGSWSAADFYPVFSWWPGKINVLSREQIIADADAAGERELAQYAKASAWGLNRDVGIWLFGSGAPACGSLRVRALPHADDSRALKSPVSTAGVGTKTVLVGGAVRRRVPW